MNGQLLVLGFLLLNAIGVALVVIEGNRNFLFGFMLVSLLASLLLLFVLPVVAILALIIWAFLIRALTGVYNSLIRLFLNVDLALHDIEVSQRRRQSIIPRLEVFTAGATRHERGTLVDTINARGTSTGNLVALFEQYPNLRANETFLRLMGELVRSEDEIRNARVRYIESVRDFNTAATQFPAVLLARALAFSPRDFLPV